MRHQDRSIFFKMFRPLLLLLGLTLLTVAAQAQCPTSIDGVSYPNLPQLTNSGPAATQKDWSLTGTDSAVYNWNICAVQNSCPSECGTPGTVACQSCASGAKSIGILSSQTIQVTPGINSVNFIYGQGSISQGCGGIARNSNISVACSLTAGTSATAVLAQPNCNYNIIMTSSFACPIDRAPPPPSGLPLPPSQVPAMADMQRQWGEKLGWTGNASAEACTWAGVQCSKAGLYQVVSSIDVSASDLCGAIPESISAISSLAHFNCSQNPLIGGQIPEGLGTISSLHTVDMSYCGLSGNLPENLQAKRLAGLFVTSNKLDGSLQNSICSIWAYNFQSNMWDCPLPTCCGDSGNYLCIPCLA